jgi:hypothetical protein
MNIKELREKAIKRYENGESPKEIYQSLGKGKTCFFKWLSRINLINIREELITVQIWLSFTKKLY